MFVAVDIGNTNVRFGFLKEGAVIHSFKFETSLLKFNNKVCSIIKKNTSNLSFAKDAIEAIYICSVVPLANKNARSVLKNFFGVVPLIIGENLSVPLMNKYRIPRQVGQDRLVNAYAGLKIYGPGLIILDFGTAITFDVLSKKSEYAGGLITPGFKMMQDGLHKKTALLPHVELARPIEMIGLDTVSSIRAGLVYGVASLCDGIIDKLLSKECRGFRVVATGGDARLVKPYSSRLSIIDDHLILKGLFLIFASQSFKK